MTGKVGSINKKTPPGPPDGAGQSLHSYFFSVLVSFLVSALGGLLGGWVLPFVIARSPEAGKRGEKLQ